MYLSLASWSFSSLGLEETAQISKLLGINALDISTRRGPAVDRAQIVSDPLAAAARVKALNIKVPNYFHHFGDSHADRNLALPGALEGNLRDFESALKFADAASIATIFFVPGAINPGQTRDQATAKSIESIKVLLEMQKDFDAEICFEPIVHSVADSPDATQKIVAETGIRLALDYSHFVCLGFTQDQIAPLCAHAAHVHLRQAHAGTLQTKFAEGVIHFEAMFASLSEAGYTGALAIEYIRSGFGNAQTVDIMTETIAMRDCFNAWNVA